MTDAPSYSPDPRYSSNPSGGSIIISRSGTGDYIIYWEGVDPVIFGAGNVQVAGVGSSNQCKVDSQAAVSVQVKCFNARGMATGSYFSVLMGS